MLNPESIPQFTGDLDALEQDYTALKTDAGHIRSAGQDIHNRFQGLSAYYTAPEAEQLFATTQPVKDRADTFADDLETVSGALAEYAAEVRPLKQKLEQLKQEATTFVNSVKDDKDWNDDEDKVAEYNRIRDEITQTVAAFWAAERTCHNKITALWHGTQMVAGDGSNKKNQYGFTAEDLKNAKLPWGEPVEEKHHWWEVGHWVKSFVWDGLIVDGVWGTIKGLGTLVGFGGWKAMGQAWKGLAQLATGLALSVMPGTAALFWTLPDDKLPSWIRDSRTAMKQTGKALVAWDEWSKNPARAAGAVTFNVLTTVFTGGAGGAASGAGKAGAVARAISLAGKAGHFIDPMTYVAKGAGAGLSKIGDIAKGLKGVGNIKIPQLPENAITLPEGTVHLPDGTVHLPEGSPIPQGATQLPNGTIELPHDVPVLPEGTTKLPSVDGSPAQYMDPHGNLLDHQGTIVQHADQAPVDVVDKPHPESGSPAAGANTPHTPTPAKTPAMAAAGVHTAEQAGHHIRLGNSLDHDLGDLGRIGDDVPTTPTIHAGGDLPSSSLGDHLPGGTADHLPSSRLSTDTPTNSVDTHTHTPAGTPEHTVPGPRTDDHVPGSHTTDTAPGHDLPSGGNDSLPGHGAHTSTGAGVLDDAAGFGDNTLDTAEHVPGGSEPSAPPGPTRPSFMYDGDNPYGPKGALTPEQIHEIQVYRANHEPGYFEEFYKKNGNRKDLDLVDESGTTPPQLTRESEQHPWIAAKDAPPPLRPRYLGDWIKGSPDGLPPESLEKLHSAAQERHFAIHHDTVMERWKQDASHAHEQNPTWETEAEMHESKAAYRESHVRMRDASEAFGEAVAEHHVIPEHYPNAVREPLDGPLNGNDQFDQVWRREDGGYVVVEAKSSVDTDLGARNLPDGRRVSQGTRGYFLDIIREMEERGKKNPRERELARNLRKALQQGKVDYIVVKGEKNTGRYTGYHMRQFDISPEGNAL